MCCGKAQLDSKALAFITNTPIPVEGYTLMRYVGTSGGSSTWSGTPSKSIYTIGSTGALFYAHPSDVAWFLGKKELGAKATNGFAFRVEPTETQEPVIEIQETPQIEIQDTSSEITTETTTNEDTVIEPQLSFSAQEEPVVMPKRTRKRSE